MKKIYFNERFIAITDLSDGSLGDGIEQIVVTDHKDMPNLLKYFDERPSLAALILKSNDAKALFKAFAANFTRIDAAGGVVQNAQGEVLLIKRFDRWDLPKGKVERHEEVDDAALREVEEECGISGVELGELITKTYHVYPLDEKMMLKRTYWYAMEYRGSEPLVPQTNEAITDAVWAAPNELEAYLSNTYETIRDVFRKAQL